MMQPAELQLRILRTIGKNVEGASTYMIYEDLKNSNFKNKPRVMGMIKVLQKHYLISEARANSGKIRKQLTADGKLLVDVSNDIYSFFSSYESLAKKISAKFYSHNPMVLKKLGWKQDEIREKDLYRLRIIGLSFELASIIKDWLSSRLFNAMILLYNNEFAVSVLSHIVLEALIKYFKHHLLNVLQMQSSTKMIGEITREETVGSHIPLRLTTRVLSDVQEINVEKQCSVVREELSKLKEVMYRVVEQDAESLNMRKGLSQLEEMFNKDKTDL